MNRKAKNRISFRNLVQKKNITHYSSIYAKKRTKSCRRRTADRQINDSVVNMSVDSYSLTRCETTYANGCSLISTHFLPFPLVEWVGNCHDSPATRVMGASRHPTKFALHCREFVYIATSAEVIHL